MPDKGEVNKDNLPGRRCKRHKTETTFPTTVNLAHISTDEGEMLPIIHDPHEEAKKDIKWKNTLIVFMTTKTVQKGTNRHFAYISETAASMTMIPWMLCEPKFGHFIQAAEQIAVKCVPIVCIESDSECHNVLQSLWKETNIVNTVSAAIRFITE
eukprot:3833126-Ditylum_brightwellii.AAC.1